MPLSPETRISLDGAEPITLAELFEANPDLSEAERAEIETELETLGCFYGGGGAAEAFTITREA